MVSLFKSHLVWLRTGQLYKQIAWRYWLWTCLMSLGLISYGWWWYQNFFGEVWVNILVFFSLIIFYLAFEYILVLKLVQYQDWWQPLKYSVIKVIPFLAYIIILGLMIGFSLLLLILPGVWLGVRLSFSGINFILGDNSIVGAFKTSWHNNNGKWWVLFSHVVVLVLINFFWYTALFTTNLTLTGLLLFQFIFMMFFSPLLSLYWYTLYEEKAQPEVVSVSMSMNQKIIIVALGVLIGASVLAWWQYDKPIIIPIPKMNSVIVPVVDDVETLNKFTRPEYEFACNLDQDCIWATGCCKMVPNNDRYLVSSEYNQCQQECQDDAYVEPLGFELKCINHQCQAIDVALQ